MDRVLNRHKYTEEQHQERRKRREIIDADSPKEKAPSASSTAMAKTKKPHFYIMESVDPRTNTTVYVVTDGGNARTECPSREFATQILRALEKAQ